MQRHSWRRPGVCGADRVEIGDIGRFRDSNHLASYAGVAPRKEESGTSVHKRRKRKGGNRRLKNALMQSSQRSGAVRPFGKGVLRTQASRRKEALAGAPSVGETSGDGDLRDAERRYFYEPPAEVDENGRG